MNQLTEIEQKLLLDTACLTINNFLENLKSPPPPISEGILKEKRGIFVTLHKNYHLRGCIGYVIGVEPLNTAVIKMAKAAAFEDPRFPPVNKNELKDIKIEISVLTPLVKVGDINEIIVGKDGLLLKNRFNQGLLLPQVPVENNWNLIQFLNYTSQKAGLSPDKWKDPETEIFKFQAQIFNN